MFPALNMELEIVRTVLQNEVNDIYVCTDLRKDTGVFYTMISVHDTGTRKVIAEKLNTERMFFSNSDYVGSFIYEDRLNLVFRYCHENLLSLLGGVYLADFSDCRNAALGFLAACAECGTGPDMGLLLLDERNVNITRDGEVRFNYFMDFSELEPGAEEKRYLDAVALEAFQILEQNYRGRYESPEGYPDPLRLFYLKMISTGFSSIGHMISMIRSMPDRLVEKKGIFWRLKNAFFRARNFLFRNSMTAFLTVLVTVTLIYAAVQIRSRIIVRRAYESNVNYYGIEYIGDIYLGNEE